MKTNILILAMSVFALFSFAGCDEKESDIIPMTVYWDLERLFEVKYFGIDDYRVKEYYLGMPDDTGIPTAIFLKVNKNTVYGYYYSSLITKQELYFTTIPQASADFLTNASQYIGREITTPQAGTTVKGARILPVGEPNPNSFIFYHTFNSNKIIKIDISRFEGQDYVCSISYYIPSKNNYNDYFED